MPDNQLLLNTANALKLDDDRELLEALGTAIANLDKLKPKINGLADAEDLINKIAQGLSEAEVAKAFKDLGLETVHGTLVDLIAKVVDADKKIPAKYKALLNPLSHFKTDTDDALVEWSVSTPSKPEIKTDRYTLDLGANAGVSLDAFAKWPDDATSPKLLRLGAHGELKASASAKIPYVLGPITAGASVSAKPTLDYYFAPSGDPIFAAAVATRLLALPDPFDFASIWDGFQDDDLKLEGVIYEFNGSANANLKVAVTNPLPLSMGLTGSLGVKVAVSASLNSKYLLRLRKSDAGIHAVLSRDKVSEETFGMELKLELDVSAAAKPALEALHGLADQWDAALKEIRPFLSPGTYLREKVADQLTAQVGALVQDDELRKAILSDARGALGLADPGEPQIVEWLAGKVAGAIDQGSALVDGQLDKVVDQVMGKLAKALPTLAANDPSGQLKDLVSEQVGVVNKKLAEAVGELFKKPSSEVKKALEKAGAKVSGAVASADALLKPVRDLLKKYDDALHDMLKKVDEGAKQKATARLFAEESRRQGTIVEIDGHFTGRTPEAGKVFEALTRGDFDRLVRVIDGPEPAGFDLTEDKSSATRFSEYKSKQGLEVMFFGVTVSLQEFVTGKAKIKLDGHGDIHVATEGQLKKTLSLGSDREVSFVDNHTLVMAKALRDANLGKATLTVGIGASYSEKFLEAEDVQQFMRGLAGVQLIRPEAPGDAGAVFDGWEKASASGKVRADIAADLNLTGAQAERLMRLGSRDDKGLNQAARLEIITVGLKWLSALKAFNDQQFKEGADYALSRCIVGTKPETLADLILRHQKCIGVHELPIRAKELPGIPHNPGRGAGTATVKFTDFLAQAFGLLRLVDLIDAMGAVYTATPKIGAGQGWDEDEYLEHQTTMARSSKYQLHLATTVFNLFKADLTPRTLAFMRTIADLTGDGEDGKPAVQVTLTNRDITGPEGTARFG